jgi:hypothetical protein
LKNSLAKRANVQFSCSARIYVTLFLFADVYKRGISNIKKKTGLKNENLQRISNKEHARNLVSGGREGKEECNNCIATRVPMQKPAAALIADQL